jgi:hypothetical protein
MPSGYDANTVGALVLNVPVVWFGSGLTGTTVTGTKFGLTQGGVDFDPGRKDREIEFDGKRAPVQGLEYPIDYDSTMKFKVIVFGDDQVSTLEPGSTTVGEVITPISTSTLYPASAYLTDVRAAATTGDGGLFVVHFPIARVISWKLDSKDKQESMLDVVLKAFLDADDAVTSRTAARTASSGCRRNATPGPG